jgi:hypothetical protein
MPTKINIGSVEIVALVDLPFELPWSMMFPGREQSEIEPYQAMYPFANGKNGFKPRPAPTRSALRARRS